MSEQGLRTGGATGEMTQHVTPLWVLIVVFLALVALTLLTVWVAFVDLGPWNAPVAVAIASLKAGLVVVIFMEMRFGQPLTWLAAAAGVLFFFLLVSLIMADVVSRGWMGVPGR